jgi:hypothetical protein
MAAELQKLQIVKRNGQISLFDVGVTTDYLLEMRPCIFDRIDKLVLKDDTWVEEEPDFDPDIE